MQDWLKKYADFSGRANRAELGIIIGLSAIIMAIGNYLDVMNGPREVLAARMGKIELLSFIIVLLPILSVGFRRLHDSNRSGLWLLLFYVPYLMWLSTENNPQGELFANGAVLIGAIALGIYLLMPGDKEENRFGPPPTPIVDTIA